MCDKKRFVNRKNTDLYYFTGLQNLPLSFSLFHFLRKGCTEDLRTFAFCPVYRAKFRASNDHETKSVAVEFVFRR